MAHSPLFVFALFSILLLINGVKGQYGNQSPINVSYADYVHPGEWVSETTSVWALVHLPDDYATTTTKVFLFFRKMFLSVIKKT
jgi:hypothetical protein